MRSMLIVGSNSTHHNVADVVHGALAAQPELDILVVAPHAQSTTAITTGTPRERHTRQIVCDEARQPDAAIVIGFLYALAREYTAILHLRLEDRGGLQAIALGGSTPQPVGWQTRSVYGGHVGHWPRYRQVLSENGATCARTVIRIPAHDLRGAWSWIEQPLRAMQEGNRRMPLRGLEIDLTYCTLGSARTGRDLPIVWTQRTWAGGHMSGRLIADDLSAVWRLRPLHLMAPIVRRASA